MAQKIFITKSGKAVLTCPKCGKVKPLDVSGFHSAEKEVKFKCTCACSHVFSVILERRLHVRKNVNLEGSLIFGHKRYPVKVADISRLGMMIRAGGVLNLNLGDKVIIDFVLDDAGQSRVSKEVIVRTIHKTDIGVEFLSQDHYDRFGPYILFHFG